ncbi:MAG: glycoside hydrolase family 3 protein [Caldilineaceae bacterium]|nr:glycoside hydrolase family 3 protein [Caldilineaceae bacterium]
MTLIQRCCRSWLTLLLLLALLLPRPSQAQTPSPLPTVAPPALLPTTLPPAVNAAELSAQVDAILAQMSVADRVGQLFIIGFEGGSAGFDSDVAELLYGYRVGGVVLSTRNNNLINERGIDTPSQVATLVNRLQALAYGLLLPADRALQAVSEETWPPPGSVSMEQVTTVPPVNLPLLIGMEQSGDGLPMTTLRRGFSPLPSAMALGATWHPELTYRVGQVVGRELTAVGVNLLLGPSLNVLDQPRTDVVGTLGLQSFGGDPDWVSQMGRAYIAGVHVGSGRRVATIARHFPGAGDADRLPDQEVATVQRSAAELERVTLPPFLAVTRAASTTVSPAGDPAVTDGLMSSHIRYSGLQGASLGRNTPISLAPELAGLLARPGFAEWRAQGGVVMSNMLGAPALRRYYDPTLQEFPYRRVAMDAFTAGHDLLYLDRFSLDDNWESAKFNIKETIAFFQERYQRDADFAAQVNAAVRRIIMLKLRLYAASPALEVTPGQPIIPLDDVLIGEEQLQTLSSDAQAEALIIMGQVARESFTVLYPDPGAVAESAMAAPQVDERILVVTDSRIIRECATCVAETTVAPDELSTIISRLYGPNGTGQLSADQVVSLTFADVAQVLDAEATPQPTPDSSVLLPTPTSTPPPTPDPATGSDAGEDAVDKNTKTRQLIDEADWIIFAMLDVDTVNHPASDVVKDFLAQLGVQRGNKRIVVLALHAPYFLDATEISKLSGYYGVYGKTQPFLESAVRALFRAYTPVGAPPVSVPGTRFANLAERLGPDPSQPIDMLVLDPDGDILAGEATSAGTSLPEVEAGTLIRIQAGPILDYNRRPVRNGTSVELVIAYEDDGTAREVVTVATQNGVAARDVVMTRGGVAQITARAGAAISTETVALSVQGGAAIVATPMPTDTTSQTAMISSTIAPTTTIVPIQAETPPNGGARLSLVSLLIALLTMMATVSLLVVVQVRVLPRQTLVHSMLWAVNCGLGGYILYGLGLLPGGGWLQGSLPVWGTGLVVFIAMLLPLVWLQLRTTE